ncbi:MAG: hypothetical protein ABT940_07920 [Alphaproteobacteria bacterium]
MKERVLAANLAADGRVGPARETDYVTMLAATTSSTPFTESLTSYFNTRIRFTYTPEFMDDTINAGNIAWRRTGRGRRRAKLGVAHLMHFLNLSQLGSVFAWANDITRIPRGLAAFFPYRLNLPRTFTDRQIRAWLDTAAADPATHQDLIGGICLLLNTYRRYAGPYEPKWAAWADDIRRVGVGADGADLLETVGVAAQAGDWVAAFTYQVREMDALVRPTQLDAGPAVLHFPPPRPWSTNPHWGGAAMDLRDGRDCHQPPVREFIHTHVPLDVRHWIDAGQVLLRVTGSSAYDLERVRYCHQVSFDRGIDCGDRGNCASWSCARCP